MSESNSGDCVTPAHKKRKTKKQAKPWNGKNSVCVSQTPIDPRWEPELGRKVARKWRFRISHDSGRTQKTVGSEEAAETLRIRFEAQYLDSTTQISKEDAQLYVKTRFFPTS